MGGAAACAKAASVTQQAINTGLHEALLPAPDHRLALARPPHDLGSAQTLCREQDDLPAPNMFLRTVPIGYGRGEPRAIRSGRVHHDSFAHSPDSHPGKPLGILKRTRV